MFEWDPRKAEANAVKHGVAFDDTVTVFLDADALDGRRQFSDQLVAGIVGRVVGLRHLVNRDRRATGTPRT